MVIPRAARHAPLVPLEPREVIEVSAADDRRRPRERRGQVLHRRRALDADDQSRIREGEPVADRRRQREPIVKCWCLGEPDVVSGRLDPIKVLRRDTGERFFNGSREGAFDGGRVLCGTRISGALHNSLVDFYPARDRG